MRVRTVRALLWSAHSQRRIFFCEWVTAIDFVSVSLLVGSGDRFVPKIWHPRDCSPPSGFITQRARGARDVVTLVAIARAPPPFLSLRHTSGWTSERGVRAMIVTHAVVARAPPLVTSRERRYVFML